MIFRRLFYLTVILILCKWSICVDSHSEIDDGTKKDGDTCESKPSEVEVETPEVVTKQSETSEDKCRNLHKDCDFWAFEGECDNNIEYMHYKCAKACNTCELQTDEIRMEGCIEDEHEDCAKMASEGDCDKNPQWMRQNCEKSCNFCFYEDRCRIHLKRTPGIPIKPMNLDHFVFDRIMGNETLVNKYGIAYEMQNPPILSFERFLSEDLVDAFLNKPFHNFERSADAGDLLDNFTYEQIYSDYRTSWQSWCEHDCFKDEVTNELLSRMEEITQIPRENYEQLQTLKYEVGQYYNTHHDFIEVQWDMICGPRILTFFIYLSDVEDGGETAFPRISLAVKPKKGKAILWSNVLSDDYFVRDDATHHSAQPVKKGLKYGTNAWIHLYEFRDAWERGCTG